MGASETGLNSDLHEEAGETKNPWQALGCKAYQGLFGRWVGGPLSTRL
jgi:hypothetical protein